jgi:hypothetical protein
VSLCVFSCAASPRTRRLYVPLVLGGQHCVWRALRGSRRNSKQNRIMLPTSTVSTCQTRFSQDWPTMWLVHNSIADQHQCETHFERVSEQEPHQSRSLRVSSFQTMVTNLITSDQKTWQSIPWSLVCDTQLRSAVLKKIVAPTRARPQATTLNIPVKVVENSPELICCAHWTATQILK